MIWVSIFFFFSGLCSIVYELVWLRLAMAKFGVTTALVSIVLSVFMAGLGAGSWLAGAWCAVTAIASSSLRCACTAVSELHHRHLGAGGAAGA